MKVRIRKAVAAVVMAAAAALAGHAFAWGSTGHRIIGRLAMASLPPDVPAFLRTPAATEALGELAREPDRWKAAGKAHDSDRDPGHFLDLGDDGRVLGGPVLAALPATREEYETALRAAGADSWKAGYLPYSIIEGWQQLAKDFAYWRVDTAAAARATDRAHRAWLTADAREREALTLRDLGTLAHYVGDGSQPLHVSEHFNGWGPFPNPRGYTQDRVHAPFEGAFVRAFVSPAAVRRAMSPPLDCRCSIETRTEAYLAHTNSFVAPFYDLYKAHAFSGPDPRGEVFAAERLAAGASELRDLVAAAWRASAAGNVGWPAVSVADVEAGKVDPYDSLYGVD
ncbi:MAG TPA: S1/P1 Nuclease [Caulobacteraceae bacterium]